MQISADRDARIAQLEAENAYLRGELGLTRTVDQLDRLRSGLSISPSQAALLLALAGAQGRPLTIEQLEERLPSARGNVERDTSIVRVLVHQLRRQLGDGVIETGTKSYRIGAHGAGLVAQALASRSVAA